MIRTVNFAFIAVTGLVCLGLYRVAEEARVAQNELRSTRAAIARETDLLAVLGAEWAKLTQPARIQALAARHLDLSDKPVVELSSVSALPGRNFPLPADDGIRSANATLSEVPTQTLPSKASYPGT
jgi:hypothetical protein